MFCFSFTFKSSTVPSFTMLGGTEFYRIKMKINISKSSDIPKQDVNHHMCAPD